MKRFLIFFATSLLAACASTPAPPPSVVGADCGKRAAHHRGHEDASLGQAPDASFVALCAEGERDDYRTAYTESFNRKRRLKEARQESHAPASVPMPREPASDSWVCEVEGGRHVFTGVGATKADASGAAALTCGSNLEASSCGPAECSSQM